jgi:hypothetical protein
VFRQYIEDKVRDTFERQAAHGDRSCTGQDPSHGDPDLWPCFRARYCSAVVRTETPPFLSSYGYRISFPASTHTWAAKTATFDRTAPSRATLGHAVRDPHSSTPAPTSRQTIHYARGHLDTIGKLAALTAPRTQPATIHYLLSNLPSFGKEDHTKM